MPQTLEGMVHPRSAPQLLGIYPKYKHLYPNNPAGNGGKSIQWENRCLQKWSLRRSLLRWDPKGQQCWPHIKLFSPGKALLAPKLPSLSLVETLATFRETLTKKVNLYHTSSEAVGCLMQPKLEMTLGWPAASLAGYPRVWLGPSHPPAWQCWTQ